MDVLNPIKMITSLFGGGDKTPAPAKVKVAPTPDDAARRRGAERTAARTYGATGRASTLLSEDTKLG